MEKATGGITGLGDLWAEITSNRGFIVPKFEWLEIKYGVGHQPMGAKSSWIVMHTTHWLINEIAPIRTIRRNLDLEFESGFEVVGDDAVMNSVKMFDSYKEILSKLYIPINLNKTLISVSKAGKPVFLNILK